jgi:hypothetical protein
MKNSTNRILAIAVVLLLLLNVAMVIYIVNQRSHSRNSHGNPFEMLDKDLNMDEQQKTEVKKLRDEHFDAIRPFFDSIRAAKADYFSLVNAPNVTDSLLNVYNDRINQLQSKTNKITFGHFRSVMALLNAEQQKKYEAFIHKMMQRRKDSAGKKK